MNAAEPLLSAAWYRVAGLRARLDERAAVVRQVVRGKVWHVLSDPGSGRQLRLNPPAYAFAARCDGSTSVDQVWHSLIERMGDAAPSQDDILHLLAHLQRAGLMRFDSAPNLAAMFERRGEDQRQRRRAWINPLALKLRLFDPTRLIDRIEPRLRFLFSAPVLALWAAAVALAGLGCALDFAALRGAAAQLDAPRSVLLLWLCYPPIKALHELAHALAVRRFGGAVREAGITLLLFTPAPYVDASAASAFKRRRERIIVSAVGIMLELAIAALAAGIWLLVEPGLVRDCAFVTLFICSVSTLLFNGNPLLRFDAYFVLCDALDLPNLAQRSDAWWAATLRRLLLGEAGMAANLFAPGEHKWLIFHAPLAWVYRTALLVTLVLSLGAKSWLIGAALGVGLSVWLLARPASAFARMVGSTLPAAARRRALGLAGTALACAATFLFAVPLPSSTVAQGVVWPPERAQVRAETAGFVDALAVDDASDVVPGQTLLRLAEPALGADYERQQSQLTGHKARQYTALLRDPLAAANIAIDIERTEAELARTAQQLAQLEVRGGSGGRLVLPHAADLPGSYAARGAMLGYILAPGPANVRAVLSEDDAQLVHARAQRVELRLAEAAADVLPATLEREPPAATRSLPSAALGERAGGRFATDPADRDGLRTIDPVFLLDVAVPAALPQRIGGRVWLRFDLGHEPLGTRWLRRMRQLMLRHFNPAGQV